MAEHPYYDCDDNVFLRDVCKELNLSRRRYAALIGAYPDTVDSWFSGRHRPPKAVILLTRIMQKFQVVRDHLSAEAPLAKSKPRGKPFPPGGFQRKPK